MQLGLLAATLANLSQCFAAFQADHLLDSIAVELCVEHAVDWECFRAAALNELVTRLDLAVCLSTWL